MRMVEMVERRVLMAAGDGGPLLLDEVEFVGSVMIVEGTDGADRIIVDLPGGRFFEGPPLRVTVNGVTQDYEASALGGLVPAGGSPDLTKIVINGRGGDDRSVIGERVRVGAEIQGGSGNDLLVGGGGNDTMEGGAGIDNLHGRGGEDELVADAADLLVQDDVPLKRRVRVRKDGILMIRGTMTADEVVIEEDHGGEGALSVKLNGETRAIALDRVRGIVVRGGDGDDAVYADGSFAGAVTSIPMTLLGGNGRDHLYGGAGDDSIKGGVGDDVLFGSAGNDMLMGGGGGDLIKGGDGQDVIWRDAEDRVVDLEKKDDVLVTRRR